MNAESIARALEGRRLGSQWMARCPAHDDRNPSLSISEKDGNVLVHCHAGCPQRAVTNVLKARGLWKSARTHLDSKRPRPVVEAYDYTDEHGNLLYQVVRYEPKGFAQRRPDGRGGWIWRKHPHQVLYHLPEVLESAITFVVEGEKDVNALRANGFVATTNAGGARAPWLPQYNAALRGQEVVIIPDNDRPGWERAAVIARALLGIAARIRVLDLPTNVIDISDWFALGHSELELIATLGGVHAV